MMPVAAAFSNSNFHGAAAFCAEIDGELVHIERDVLGTSPLRSFPGHARARKQGWPSDG